jgi:nucleoside phosphorylase
MADALLLAAFPPELGGLDAVPPPGWQVALTGVGAVAAAAVTARLLCERRPSRVLFVGTCGAYDDRLPVGALLAASEVVAVSQDERAGRAYRPGVEVSRWPATLALPLPGHVVAVTPAITTDPEGARRLAEVAAAEHLELSGVFAACALAGVPVGGALGVANRVGPEAHAEWKRHHAAVSRALLLALAPFLGDVAGTGGGRH